MSDVTDLQLRDYFAGQALAGLTSRMTAEMVKRYFSGHYDGREAVVAYAIADAMLEERTWAKGERTK